MPSSSGQVHMSETVKLDIHRVTIIGNQHLSRAIVGALHRRQEFELTIITSKGQEPYLPGDISVHSIDHHTTDFTQSSLEKVLRGQDLLISTIAPSDFDLQKRIVDACLAVNVRTIIPNEFGFDSQNSIIQHRLPSYRARNRMIEHLKAHEDQLSWVGIAVGSILDHDILNGKLGFDLKWHSASISGNPKLKFPATSSSRVGEIVAAIVAHLHSFRNSYVYANGFVTNADELVRMFEQEMKVVWATDCHDVRSILGSAERMLSGGWPDAGWTAIERTIVFDPEVRANEPFISRDAIKRLDLPEERVQDVVRRIVHEWTHTARGDCGCN